MSGSVFFSPAIGFVCGIALASFYSLTVYESLLALLLGVACVVLAQNRKRQSGYLFCIGLFFSALAIGFIRFEYENHRDMQPASFTERSETYVGVVVREPEKRSSTMHLYVKLTDIDELVLVITDPFLNVRYGDEISIIGKPEIPTSFETDLGRVFDYQKYLHARGVRYTIPFAKVSVATHGVKKDIRAYLFKVKESFMLSVEKAIREPQAGLGEGVLLGVKRALGEDLEEAFRKTSIIHIVVLSGYNVMIVAEAMTRLLARFFYPRTRLILGVLAIGLFAILVGLSATVVRASIMAVLILIARATGRTYAIMRALFFAGIVMLVINPYLLVYDPGFQLSFLATFGLIVLAPTVERWLLRAPSTFGVREYLTATISTQIFVTPFLLYLIGSFSVVAVLVNVLVLPMVPIAMLLTFITGIVGFISAQLAIVFGFFADLSLLYIVKIAELFAWVPFASFSVPKFPFILVVLSYVVFAFVIGYLTGHTVPIVVDKSKKSVESKHDLSGWTIVEEIESPSTQSVEGDATVFPFR